jgi:hypothetical protein
MPDGDIFQRSLRGTGKGWVSVFRLSAYGDSFEGLESQISKACSDNFRRIPREIIEQCLHVLISTLEAEGLVAGNQGLRRANTFLRLENDLRLIPSSAEFELVTLLKESVRSVFAANQFRVSELRSSEIPKAVGEALVSKLFDNRVSRVRNELIKASGRSINEQFELEGKLKSSMVGVGQKLMNDFCSGRKFRAPVFRRRQPRKSAAEFLNQPIQVIA